MIDQEKTNVSVLKAADADKPVVANLIQLYSTT